MRPLDSRSFEECSATFPFSLRGVLTNPFKLLIIIGTREVVPGPPPCVLVSTMASAMGHAQRPRLGRQTQSPHVRSLTFSVFSILLARDRSLRNAQSDPRPLPFCCHVSIPGLLILSKPSIQTSVIPSRASSCSRLLVTRLVQQQHHTEAVRQLSE